MKEATELWFLIIGGVVAFATALVKTWKNLRRLSRMVDEFLGYENHPGVSERVDFLERELSELRGEVAELKRLVSVQYPHGGL